MSGSQSEGGAGGSSGAAAALAGMQGAENAMFSITLWMSLTVFIAAFTLYRITLVVVRYLRTLTCMNNEKQAFFQSPVQPYAFVKEYLVYAPLFRTRHHRELWLVKGWSIGVLPTRFQSLFLAAIIGMNVAFCTIGIEWSQAGSSQMLNDLRNRTGTIAVANMLPLVLLAGRNNPLIIPLGLSYDTFNMIHRWFGRIIAAEAVAHAVSFFLNKVNNGGGWNALAKALASGSTPTTGLIAVIAFCVIVVQASTILRRAFYELFLHLHVLLVVLATVALWYHLDGLPQQMLLKAFIIAWGIERGLRLIILLYRNLGRGGTKAVVQALPGDAVKVDLEVARPWSFKPGQHMFVTMPSVGLWTSHPFSLAWSAENVEISDDPEKGMVVIEDIAGKTTTTVTTNTNVLGMSRTHVSAIIRARDGFTGKLLKKAAGSVNGRFVANAYVEGPYGGQHSLRSYGTVVLVAGGVGITHQIPYIRDLLVGHANGTVAARRVSLIWVIQSPEALEWIRPWMTSILALECRRDLLHVQLFITKPRSAREIQSPSATIQMFPGRPNIDTLMDMECRHQVGAMAVTVCGPGHLADDVRRCARKRQSTASIDFIEESFSW